MNNESVTDLVKIWIDMMRPITQYLIDETSEQWPPTLSYHKSIENIENAIAEKLQITVVEVKVMLIFIKKTKDLKERKLFKKEKTKEKTMVGKRRRIYFEKLESDMRTINNSTFKAHHEMTKLSSIIISDSEDKE